MNEFESDPTQGEIDALDTPSDVPTTAVSSRQQRYDELVQQGLSSADALAQEEYEYRTKRDNERGA